MKYRNTKTQAVIETACVISGGNWVEVEAPQPKAEAETPVKKTVAKTATKATAKTAAKKTNSKKSGDK